MNADDQALELTETEEEKLREDFDRDGFVVIRGYLNAEELREMRSHCEEYAGRVKALDDVAGGVIKGLDQDDPWFRDYLEGGKHIPLMKRLISDGLAPDNVTWINKSKSIERTMPHYDAIGSYLTPPSGVSLWIALDDIDRNNGCLHYEKGSHLRDFPNAYPLPNYDEQNENVVAVEARAGDAVMHSTKVIHFSIDVVEERPRHAMVYAYWGGSAKINPNAPARSKSAYAENRLVL